MTDIVVSGHVTLDCILLRSDSNFLHSLSHAHCIIFEKSYINHTVTWECYCEGQIIIGWFFFCPNKCFLGPNFPLNSLFIHLWTKYIFLTSHNLINIVHVEILNLNFLSKTTQRPFNTNLHQIVICLFFLRGSTDSFHPARSTSSVFALHYGTTVRNHLFLGFLFFYLMYFSMCEHTLFTDKPQH